MEIIDPIVSIVIPTRDRPELVRRAIGSALEQTFTASEVIVVIDGPDDVTMQVLSAIKDPRLRIKALPSSLGGAAARNVGVVAAKGRWIAFLDDDDEWLPTKLDTQLRTAQHSVFPDPVVSCRLLKRSEAYESLLPRRFPIPGESMSEYLFRRTRLFGGEGLVQTSTILTTKALMKQVPFRAGTKRHQDLEWLLQIGMRKGTMVEFVPETEPLVIWYKEAQRTSVSSGKDWRYSLSWIQQNRHLVTSRAYGSFLLTWVSASAIQQGERSAFWPLLRDAFSHGSPSALDVFVFIGIWLIPPKIRECIAFRCSGKCSLNPKMSSGRASSSTSP